jgi:hypothetical protein
VATLTPRYSMETGYSEAHDFKIEEDVDGSKEKIL